jgi:hypothetical protein
MTEGMVPSLPVAGGVGVELHKFASQLAFGLERRRRTITKWLAVGFGTVTVLASFSTAILIQAPLALWPLFAFVGLAFGISVAFATMVAMSIWGELGTRLHFHRQARRLGLRVMEAESAFQQARIAADDHERTKARAAQHNQPKTLFERSVGKDRPQ